jgi:hypothetical protein
MKTLQKQELWEMFQELAVLRQRVMEAIGETTGKTYPAHFYAAIGNDNQERVIKEIRDVACEGLDALVNRFDAILLVAQTTLDRLLVGTPLRDFEIEVCRRRHSEDVVRAHEIVSEIEQAATDANRTLHRWLGKKK